MKNYRIAIIFNFWMKQYVVLISAYCEFQSSLTVFGHEKGAMIYTYI